MVKSLLSAQSISLCGNREGWNRDAARMEFGTVRSGRQSQRRRRNERIGSSNVGMVGLASAKALGRMSSKNSIVVQPLPFLGG